MVNRYFGLAEEINYDEIPFQFKSITAVDTSNNTFTVSGDQLALFGPGTRAKVQNSTGNDGDYIVADATYDSGADETTVTVKEDVTDSTVDGELAGIDIEYFDIAETDISPPDDQAATYDSVATRARRYQTASDYMLEGDVVLPVTSDKFGKFLEGTTGEVNSTQIDKTFSITAVDTTNDTVTIAGDETRLFQEGDTVEISGSTGNDGTYTVESSSYDSGTDETTVALEESIGDSTADGNLIHKPDSYEHLFTQGLVLPHFCCIVGKDWREDVFKGVMLDEMSLELNDRFLEATFSTQGSRDTKFDNITNPPESRLQEEIITTADGIWKIDGTDRTADVLEFSWTHTNNIDLEFEIPTGQRFPANPGTAQRLEIETEMTLRFDSSQELENFWGLKDGVISTDGPGEKILESSQTISFVEDPEVKAFEVYIPRGIRMSYSAPISGRDQVEQTVSFNALHHDAQQFPFRYKVINTESSV